jgi:hypothetical protein
MRERVQEDHGRSERGTRAPTAAPGQHDLVRLQRTAGNRAVRRLLARQPAQATAAGSKLVGRRRTLSWDDYTGAVPKGSPYEAQTKTTIDVKVDGAKAGESSFEGSAGAFKLKDAVVITVDLDRKKCWKKESIDNATATEQRLMLEHEQAHYDINALMARDMFIEIMALKPRSFASATDGFKELADVINRHGTLLTTIDALYDSSGETGHKAIEHLSFGPPRKPTAQAKWEGYIKKAFTEERTPTVTAPDGATYKIRLVDVLRGAGHSV